MGMKSDLMKEFLKEIKDKKKGKGMIKATIVSDSPEGLAEGAEKLEEMAPEISSAEEYMKKRMKSLKKD